MIGRQAGCASVSISKSCPISLPEAARTRAISNAIRPPSETGADRAQRKAAGVLYAADPLFGDAHHEFSVYHERGRRVVSLADPIVPFVERRADPPLEVHRALDSAYAD